MPAYAYPINIIREPKKIRYQKEIELESGVLTLSEVRKYVTDEERFYIEYKDSDTFSKGTPILYVLGDRLETDAELKERVTRQEKYMEEYNKRHKK